MARILLANETPKVLSTIDIQEVIEMRGPGDIQEVPFSYSAGDPAAFGFQLEWYRTADDADADQHQLNPYTYLLPTATIYPTIPVADGDQTGTLIVKAPTRDDIKDVQVLATVSGLPETVNLASATTETFEFTYTAGDPAAIAFVIDWYRSGADAAADRNRLPAYSAPTAVWTPAFPVRSPLSQNGEVTITTPATTPSTLRFVGKVGLYQQDPWEYYGKLSICQGTVVALPDRFTQRAPFAHRHRTFNNWYPR